MELKLKVLVGAQSGHEIRVPGPKFFVGRAEDCQLRPRSDLISRHHCVIVLEEDFAAIRDFGSKNGTYVNGERVTNEVRLNDTDVLKIGPLEFQVSLREVAKKRPPVNSIEEAVKRTASTEFDMDVDVSSWLSTPQAKPNDADTREIHRRDTEQVQLPTAETTVVNKDETTGLMMSAIPVESAKPAEKAKPAEIPSANSLIDLGQTTEIDPQEVLAAADRKPGDKTAPGKLPPRKNAADSHSAAADMLKKLRRR